MGFVLTVIELETCALHDIVISARGEVDSFPEVVQGMSFSDKVLGRILFCTTASRKVVTMQHKLMRSVAC
jgi:hypothetical protein